MEKKLRASKAAWTFFQAQAPWYRRTSIFWVMDARREETRARRLAALIASSARGEPITLLSGARVRPVITESGSGRARRRAGNSRAASQDR